MTPSLKSVIKRKHRVYNKYVRRGRKPDDWEYVRTVRHQTSSKITQAKDEYFSSLGKKLSDPIHGIKSLQVIFSQKKDTPVHPSLFFSGSEVVIKAEHRHLGMVLDSKITFLSHIKEAIVKARRGIGIIRFLSK